jgi:hypothetical protein
MDQEAKARMLGLLGNYTGQLNQMNARGHASGRPPPDDIWFQINAQQMEMRAVLMQALRRKP